MGSDEPRRKKARVNNRDIAPANGGDDLFGPGGLYDFLPPPNPDNDAAAKAAAEKSLFARPKLPQEDKSRVIFLDVDGVLLASGAVETISIDGVSLPVRDRLTEADFAMSALGNLRSIVQQTGALIVLSSEWRRTEALRSSIAAVLKSQDIPVFKEWTPIFQPKVDLQLRSGPIVAWCERRAREIGAWLKAHPEVTSWVALDDLDFNWADGVRVAGTPWMKIRSVHTDHKICLTDEDAAEAVRILLNPPPEPKSFPRRNTFSEPASGSGLLTTTEDSLPERIRLG